MNPNKQVRVVLIGNLRSSDITQIDIVCGSCVDHFIASLFQDLTEYQGGFQIQNVLWFPVVTPVVPPVTFIFSVIAPGPTGSVAKSAFR